MQLISAVNPFLFIICSFLTAAVAVQGPRKAKNSSKTCSARPGYCLKISSEVTGEPTSNCFDPCCGTVHKMEIKKEPSKAAITLQTLTGLYLIALNVALCWSGTELVLRSEEKHFYCPLV